MRDVIYFERMAIDFRTAIEISPPKYRLDRSLMEKRRILIVDNNDELPVLEQALERLGHEVVVAGERAKALRRDDLDSFDLIISDLADAESNGEPISDIKAFKMGAANYVRSEERRVGKECRCRWSTEQ